MNETATKKGSTRRLLTVNIVIMIASFAMLVTSTFSWFTDSASTGINRIVSGTLDIAVYYSDDGLRSWKDISGETSLFQRDDWEPGAVDVVYLKLVNEGNLALKYHISTQTIGETPGENAAGEDIKLSTVLRYAVIPDVQTPYATRTAALSAAQTAGLGYLNDISEEVVMKPGETTYAAIVVTMPSSTGNEANYATGKNAPSITLGVEVLASQAPVEYDSYSDTYDKDAPYPTPAN